METIILMVIMFGVLYFLMIRPENKRKKDAENLRNSLTVGDEITTIGGMTGTICAVKETTIVFETGADRVRIEMAKWGVSTKNSKDDDKKDKEKTDKKEKKDKDKEKEKELPEKTEKKDKKDKEEPVKDKK